MSVDTTSNSELCFLILKCDSVVILAACSFKPLVNSKPCEKADDPISRQLQLVQSINRFNK